MKSRGFSRGRNTQPPLFPSERRDYPQNSRPAFFCRVEVFSLTCRDYNRSDNPRKRKTRRTPRGRRRAGFAEKLTTDSNRSDTRSKRQPKTASLSGTSPLTVFAGIPRFPDGFPARIYPQGDSRLSLQRAKRKNRNAPTNCHGWPDHFRPSRVSVCPRSDSCAMIAAAG